MSYLIINQNDTVINSEVVNPILSKSDVGIEVNGTNVKLKIGDGISRYSLLNVMWSGTITEFQNTFIGINKRIEDLIDTNTSIDVIIQDIVSLNEIVETLKVEPSNYIYVGKNGNDTTGNGSAGTPYLTVSKAINEASSGTTIFIFPGTYIENLTLKAGVNLVAPSKYSTYIRGKVTVDITGTVYLEKIIFQNNLDIVIDFKGTNVQNVQMLMCNVESLTDNDGNAINYTNTNANSKLSIADGVLTVYTSTGGARAFSSAATALGTVLLDKTTCQILDDIDNICLDIAGGVSFIHTQDQVKGQIVVSDTASTTFAILSMYTTTVPVLITNSTGISTLSQIMAVTTSTPCFSGTGVFIFFAIGYGSTGVGGAATLNGNAGAIALEMAPIKFRASALYATVQDGLLEYDGTHLYFTIGETRNTLI